MKYILILLAILIANPTQAAYWVIDNEIPSKSHIAENLTEGEKSLLGSYGYVEVSDSVLEAVENKKCAEKYTKLLKDLQSLEKNLFHLEKKELMKDRESLIRLATKNISACLKKEGVDTSKNTKAKTKVTKSSNEYAKLETRITLLETKMREIIKYINSMNICVYPSTGPDKGCQNPPKNI